MIVDSSAVVAVLLREPGHEPLLGQLASAAGAGIGTPTLTETGIVLVARLGATGRTLLGRFIEEAEIVPVAFGERHWASALEAYLRFGKGRHPAALSFGDCMTYATASLSGEDLLCVGDAFAKTDLPLVR